jgi:EAL domain-containing protein (putative c-di-GMP-specific phosphodiesterase class I)/PAS domain-containing protein/GGDEF domain-containing protein
MGIAGRTAQEAEGGLDLWLDRVHPDDLASLRAALAGLEGGAGSFEHTHRLQGDDGAYRWVLVRGVTVRDAGRIVRIGGSLRDLTADHAARQAQSRSTLLEQAAAAAHVGVGLLLSDGSVRHADEALGRMTQPWRSPDVWWRKVSAAGRLPVATTCSGCGQPELRGAMLVELLAPPGREPGEPRRAFRVALGGHTHALTDEPGAHLLLAQDLTDEASARAALQRADERHGIALLATGDAIWTWDERDGLWVSSRWRVLMGFSEQDDVDDVEVWVARTRPEDREELRGLLNAARRGELQQLDHRHHAALPSGEVRALRLVAVAAPDGSGGVRLGGVLRADEPAREVVDRSLDLPTAAALEEDAGRALKTARRDGPGQAAVVIVDLANLPAVRGELGSLGADRLLRASAERLAAFAGGAPVHRAARDALAILVRDQEEPGRLLDTIAAALSRPVRIDGRHVAPACVVGAALSHARYSSGAELVAEARSAAHTAAREGRPVLVERPSRLSSSRSASLEASLRDALDQGELTIAYQPIVSMRTLQVTDVEALVRWRHPEHGLTPPDELVPIAEESGLVVPLGDFVLRSALAQLAAWSRDRAGTLGVSVNLSTRQLREDGLADRLRGLLDETGLDARRLQLEITDPETMLRSPDAAQRVGAVRALGVRVALDDVRPETFAAGDPGALPISGLKLDRALLSGSSDDVARHAAAVVAQGRELGVPVIAVGVETREQLLALSRLGCDEMQGYYFARPAEAAQVELLLGAWNEAARSLLPSDARRAMMRAVR